MAEVNLPVAVLIWLMIVPMLLKIDFAALRPGAPSTGAASASRSFINWAVKPFSMALLGWLFIGWLFRALAAGRPDRQLHRRPDPPGGRTLHRDGVRLVAT